jgi:hypothetical protein
MAAEKCRQRKSLGAAIRLNQDRRIPGARTATRDRLMPDNIGYQMFSLIPMPKA